ncbi:unnamed protein product [Arctia plantaginis]|uniref:Peroxidase n=1 Tax=Arctia plantaginis TaxID=874455 RepID=A0A8S1A581_ARCPL|nr:unnamed protein product [Arctia plantaginis]
MLLIYLVGLFCGVNSALFYDSYTGTEITREDVKKHDKANTTFWCVNEIEPCNPTEGRRVDGSCNNLKHPTRGAMHTPFIRLLPATFDKNFEPRKSSSGNDLPLARYLRTRLISVGKVPSTIFTMLAVHYFVFMSADVVSLHDTVNYILWKPYCCTEKGKTDYMCVPNKIPEDDPVHRFSGIRCLNMTRPESFQSIGCVKNDTVPERIISSTPLLDLSAIYGNLLPPLLQKGRLFTGGLVKTEIEEGRIWPPSYKTQANVCYLNQRPKETRWHEMPEDGSNTLGGVNLVSIWFWRYHNFIAKELAKVNPCWDDDKLFETARDINIAVSLQIYYYELLPVFFGSYQRVTDLVTNDLSKNRYFGFQPYVNYRQFCFNTPIKSFGDLHGIIDEERIEVLREVYEKVEDIDLLAGIWTEKPIRGGFVPPTYWYERPNRPNAFTSPQLAQIRKITIARMLCDIGDTVKIIQPHAFLKAGHKNPMCDCKHIISMDFSAWRDDSCGAGGGFFDHLFE